MKKIKLEKKLGLNKKTISDLKKNEMKKVKGGMSQVCAVTGCGISCWCFD